MTIPTNWDTTGEITKSIVHRHGLDTIDYYRLVTVDLPTGVTALVGQFTETEFGRATYLADQGNKGAIRSGATYRYSLDTRYECGCWSTVRPTLDEKETSR